MSAIPSHVGFHFDPLEKEAISRIRRALALWDAGYKLDLNGTDVETLLEAYDVICGAYESPGS